MITLDSEQYLPKGRVDAFAVVRLTDLVLPEGARPADLLPGAKSLILIGIAVTPEVYLLGSRQKTMKFSGIIRELDGISGEIVATLEAAGFSSVAVPAYFPARVRNGTLRGILSLKDCAQQAGLGRKGQNTLLIHPEYGNRLVLSAVVTVAPLDPTPHLVTCEICIRCMRCRKACPGGAIGEHGVELRKCLNVRHAVPWFMGPTLGLLLGSHVFAPAIESFVNRRAWNTEVVCSECVTACPFFASGSETSGSRGPGTL